ncbi:MAG: trehalose-6-phosphate synthase [Candidatus Altiarchaeia archaeon]
MLTKSNLKELVKSKLGESLFIVASNREPYVHTYKEDKIEFLRPASGMAIALDSVMQACGGVWVAHGSGDADKETVGEKNRIEVPPNSPKYTLKRVWMSKEEEERYYYGLSNETFWPLCHIVYVRPKFDESDWNTYKKINERFADAILEEVGDQKAFVWLQDFHLSLVPKILKERRPDLVTAHFWHIPWPNPEAFRICPWKEEILEGLLANDVIGFHTRYNCNNFLDTVDMTLEAKTDRDLYSVSHKGITTLVKPFPIGADYKYVSDISNLPETEMVMVQIKRKYNLNDKIVGVGVERIDYTKGIPERFKAIDRFLEKYPEYQGRFVFIQLGAPSRIYIGAYKKLNDEIEALVRDINWKYGRDHWKPIIYLGEYTDMNSIISFYKLANICIVSSLHDGMNLVAKEFVAAQNDIVGMLLLSRFAGSAREMPEAVLINPYDIEKFADAIKEGIEMPPEERKARMEKMRETVKENNIYKWAWDVISSLTKL